MRGPVEKYSFGKMVVDGVEYDEDILILGSEVKEGWWRLSGHRLSEEDLVDVLEYGPGYLVIGTGSSGMLKVPRDVIRRLDFHVECCPTGEAWKIFNREFEAGRKVAGAFHLTC